MTYCESLKFLYGLRRFGIKFGLKNISDLLACLGSPEKAFAVVHVAGTNGKGSTAAGLAEILKLAGYRTGLFTSPHLQSFTERIRVDGRPAGQGQLAGLIMQIRSQTTARPLTFFEASTALAFLYFACHDVQVAVVETGMGGRLDATNLVTPVLSVITPISEDHTQYLGATLQEIAGEKACIIKDRIPVVIGPQPVEVAEVLFGRALSVSAQQSVFGRDFSVFSGEDGFSYRSESLLLENLLPGLEGEHQHRNLALSLRAAEIMGRSGFDISIEAMREGVGKVRWPGRLQWWGRGRDVLLDGAHNGSGALALSKYLAKKNIRDIHWVVGIKSDKNPEAILSPILPRIKKLYCTDVAEECFFPPLTLAQLGTSKGVESLVCDTVETALLAASGTRLSGEIILVAGSLYVVGAAMDFLKDREML